MANITKDDPQYWHTPERFRPIQEAVADMKVRYFLMGPDEESTPVVVVLDMAPGRIITRHAHESERFEIVISGSLDVGDKVLHAGDVMLAAPGEMYGPKVVGPEGCMTVEFFSNRKGATEVLYERADGTPLHVDIVDGGQLPEPDELKGMEWALRRRAEVLEEVAGR